MDGEQLCFQLTCYKDVYFASHTPNEPEPMDTDREDVVISNLNDYTGAILKAETSTFEESRTLKVAKLCTANQCGCQDNPKTVTQSVANIVEKWDFSHQKYKHNNPEAQPKTVIKSKCYCFENYQVADDPKMDLPALVDTIIECTEKIVLHGQTFSRVLLSKGEAKKLLILMSSLKLVKNKVLYFKSLYGNIIKKDFMENDLEDMIKSMFTQVSEYYKTTISNEVLHDTESNDWTSSTPFYESQKISTSIQFWGYTIQGLRADIFNILPQQLARQALHQLVKMSLDVLTIRYCQVKPSSKRLPQYRADIAVILYICHDMLLSLIPDLKSLFHPNPKHVASRSIHQKCLTLLMALVSVGSPIKNYERYVQSCTTPPEAGPQGGPPARLEPIQKSDNDKLTCWLHLSFPGIYGHVVERLNTPSFIFLLGRTIAVQPQPNYALIARLCLSRDMEFVTLIMKNFGAFIPGIRGDNVNVRGLSRHCGHFMCHKRCIPVAGIHWPQEVGSSVLYVVMHANKDKEALKKVLSPLLSKLNPSAWSVLNKNMVWSQKRPVWLQALVDLLEPYVLPVVDEMMDELECGKAWTLAHVPDTISKLMQGLNDVACLVPESFYEVCTMIRPLVPEEVSPLCESVLVHIFVSSLYGLIDKIIPVMRSWKILNKEKMDFLIAVNEKLCNLEATEDSRRLEANNSCVFLEPSMNWDEMPEEYANTASQIIADRLMVDQHGQTALKTIHRFLSYNSEWLQKTVGVTVREVDTLADKSVQNEVIPTEGPKLLPWEDDIFRTPLPKEMVMHCCFYQYNALLNIQPSWDDCFKILIPYMNPLLLRQLLTNRPEVNDADAEEADKSSYEQVLNYINDQLLDKSLYESSK